MSNIKCKRNIVKMFENIFYATYCDFLKIITSLIDEPRASTACLPSGESEKSKMRPDVKRVIVRVTLINFPLTEPSNIQEL
jgi:hypothetical protein